MYQPETKPAPPGRAIDAVPRPVELHSGLHQPAAPATDALVALRQPGQRAQALESNLLLAQKQASKARMLAFCQDQTKPLLYCGMIAAIVRLTHFSISTLGGSTTQHPLLLTSAALLCILSVPPWAGTAFLSCSAGVRRLLSARRLDALDNDPEVDSADKLRGAENASPTDLEKAGTIYLKFINDKAGVKVTLRSLSGLHACLTRLGVCPESALLLSKIGTNVSPRYKRLPVQRELLDFALITAPEMYAQLPDHAARVDLMDSVNCLAHAAAKGDRALALGVAEELLQLTRNLPRDYLLQRASHLDTALHLTRSSDPIRENIEAQLQEIADSYLHDTTLHHRTTQELRGIFERCEIVTN